MDKANRRLSIGDALKKGAAMMDVNDDDAERAARRKSRVEVGVLPKASTISAEVTSSWLRIFSEGKLGKKDVWNVPVTDMLEKEGQSETVDFRDASLTIDASAHVYSKRVEEVLTKTTTLAGGLASEDLESFAQEHEEDPAKADDEEEIDAQAKEEKQEKRRRVSNRGANTLETNEASLTMKRNEREYAIDPLFHKRSAIFDSGGAKGLLANVLSVHNGYELVFDAADLVDDTDAPVMHVAGGKIEEELRNLVQTLLPHNWHEADICPEYAERRKGSSVAIQHLLEQMPEEESAPLVDHMDVDDEHDYGGGGDYFDRPAIPADTNPGNDDHDELRVSFGQHRADGAGPEISAAAHTTWDYHDTDNRSDDDDDDQDRGTEETLLDARLQRIEQREQETEILIQPNMDLYEVADGPNAEYTYFNRDKLANWAGPEHWKHKMKPSKKASEEDEEYQDEEGNIVKAAPAKTRGPRKTFKIDFTAPPPANLAELLQAGGASTILPKPTLDKQLRDARMLMIPPDINYDVANFGATFLPHHVVMARNRQAELEERGAAFLDNDTRGGDAAAGGPDDDDDNDDYHFNNVDDYQPFGAAAVPAANASVHTALRPGDEGYLPNVARIDKRVDVKALKNTIWRELCTEAEAPAAPAAEQQASTAMKEEKPFQEVLEVLPQFMAPEVVRDVSVSYCFVCLLHLANEKNLAIRQENLDTLFIRQGPPLTKAKGPM